MSWIQRLFMDQHQARLVDPKLYHHPLDRQLVLEELKASGENTYYETKHWAEDAVTSTNKAGPLTIAAVAAQYEEDRYLCQHGEWAGTEVAKLATMGQGILLEFLVRRANSLADGIRPGAAEALKNAL